MLRLTLVKKPDEAPIPLDSVFELDEAKTYLIGRGSGCNIRIPYRILSREQALFKFMERRWVVTDQGSKNGTTINHEKIPASGSASIRDGDMLKFSGFAFRANFIRIKGEGIAGGAGASGKRKSHDLDNAFEDFTEQIDRMIDDGEDSDDPSNFNQLPESHESPKPGDPHGAPAKHGVQDVPVPMEPAAVDGFDLDLEGLSLDVDDSDMGSDPKESSGLVEAEIEPGASGAVDQKPALSFEDELPVAELGDDKLEPIPAFAPAPLPKQGPLLLAPDDDDLRLADEATPPAGPPSKLSKPTPPAKPSPKPASAAKPSKLNDEPVDYVGLSLADEPRPSLASRQKTPVPPARTARPAMASPSPKTSTPPAHTLAANHSQNPPSPAPSARAANPSQSPSPPASADRLAKSHHPSAPVPTVRAANPSQSPSPPASADRLATPLPSPHVAYPASSARPKSMPAVALPDDVLPMPMMGDSSPSDAELPPMMPPADSPFQPSLPSIENRSVGTPVAATWDDPQSPPDVADESSIFDLALAASSIENMTSAPSVPSGKSSDEEPVGMFNVPGMEDKADPDADTREKR